jgi:hypothetical protein
VGTDENFRRKYIEGEDGEGEGSGNEEQTSGRSDQDYLPDHWRGCMEAREHPFDTTDDGQLEPDSGGGKWRRYLWPDHEQANDWSKLNANLSNHMSFGPNKYCPVELLPLTNVKKDVLDKIDEMTANGVTHINLGAVWGWRVLSPSEPYTNGAAYGDEKTNKAIVIMTHRSNSIGPFPNAYSAYGTPANDRLGNIPDRSAGRGQTELNRRLTDVCTKMKNLDILVFTIAFDANLQIKNLMSNCATDSGKYFDAPFGTDLQQAFESIAAQLRNHGSGAGSNLRIGN